MKTDPPHAKNIIRILIVDDHDIVRAGLAAVLQFEPRFEIVAMAENGSEALTAYREHLPDVVLMDIRMPVMDGIKALRQICKEFPEARVIMLSTSEASEDLRLSLAEGASGYVLKTTGRDELQKGIFTVHDGGHFTPSGLEKQMAEALSAPILTVRQMEVLDLLVKGLSNKEIGTVLGFSIAGTKKHLATIYTKLGAAGRTEAVALAMQNGLIRME